MSLFTRTFAKRPMYMGIGAAGATNSVNISNFGTESSSSGTYDYIFNNDGTADFAGFADAWLVTTPDTTFAALHEIRWTAYSDGGVGNATLLTQNIWYALSSGRTFSMTGTQGLNDIDGTITIEIRKIGTTTPVYSALYTTTILGTG